MAINVSTFSSNQSYRLTNAVLVYQDASRKPAFVSVHDVKTDGEDRPIIQAGVPASKSGLLSLMRILDPETMLRPHSSRRMYSRKDRDFSSGSANPKRGRSGSTARNWGRARVVCRVRVWSLW